MRPPAGGGGGEAEVCRISAVAAAAGGGGSTPHDASSCSTAGSEQQQGSAIHLLEDSSCWRRPNSNKRSTPSDGAASSKPYECRFCPMKFAKSQALGGHMNRHRQEREREQVINARKLLLQQDMSSIMIPAARHPQASGGHPLMVHRSPSTDLEGEVSEAHSMAATPSFVGGGGMVPHNTYMSGSSSSSSWTQLASILDDDNNTPSMAMGMAAIHFPPPFLQQHTSSSVVDHTFASPYYASSSSSSSSTSYMMHGTVSHDHDSLQLPTAGSTARYHMNEPSCSSTVCPLLMPPHIQQNVLEEETVVPAAAAASGTIREQPQRHHAMTNSSSSSLLYSLPPPDDDIDGASGPGRSSRSLMPPNPLIAAGSSGLGDNPMDAMWLLASTTRSLPSELTPHTTDHDYGCCHGDDLGPSHDPNLADAAAGAVVNDTSMRWDICSPSPPSHDTNKS